MSLEIENTTNSQETPASQQTRKLRLPQHIENRIRESLSDDRPDDALGVLEENGYCPSDTRRVMSKVGKNMEQGMPRISWDKSRLTYMTALLEHTLASENKNITSTENLLKNYAIFYRIFQDREGNPIRFGQFDYVMQNIFRGTSSSEEIYERIANHKTFGEGRFLKAEEVKQLSGEIETAFKEINQEYERAREKRKKLDSARVDAQKEEERRKGTTWTSSYCQPKEYFFPNYKFQTGLLKGRNHAEGRSSWEPMFLAYADVVNKWMEDKIAARTGISDEEKKERIKRHRIELLYEHFDFPVDVQTTKDGIEKPVIYRLDFIDINRWRAIEVKGPLTAKGAEKIRLFKKYYIDEDFSGLSPDKQILMMSYVQDKKEEIADWCREQGYPVCDHFQSLTVLGAWKWDHAINNFNKYSGAKDMLGLPDRARDHLQKGFFKLVEERIARGKAPDVRPEGYQRSDELNGVIKFNEKDSKQKNIPYEVIRPSSTKPFIPKVVADLMAASYEKRGYPGDVLLSMMQSVLETIPLAKNKKDILSAMYGVQQFTQFMSVVVEANFFQISGDEAKAVIEGKKRLTVTPRYLTRADFEDTFNNFEIFRQYLLELSKSKADVGNNIYGPEKVTKPIKDLCLLFKDMHVGSGTELRIERNTLERIKNMWQNSDASKTAFLSKITSFYEGYLLGEYKPLFDKRVHEVESIAADSSFFIERQNELFNERLQENRTKGKELFNSEFIHSLIHKTFGEERVSHQFVSLFSVANVYARKSDPEMGGLFELIQLIKRNYKSFEKAAQHFAGNDKSNTSINDYLDVLKNVNSTFYDISSFSEDHREFQDFIWSKEKIISSMAKTMLIDELGEETYNKLNTKFNDYFRKFVKK